MVVQAYKWFSREARDGCGCAALFKDMPSTDEWNAPSGTAGLIAIDKVGNRVLFLNPETYQTELTLDGFAPRVHELTISPDHQTAYVPIYGDGIHGDNPHPGHLIAVFDLAARRHTGDISTAPYVAPHGLRWGPQGQLYCVCENSGVVLEMNAAGTVQHVIEIGSTNAHRIEVMPDGSKLFCEDEEDAACSVVDLRTRSLIGKIKTPHALAGLAISPHGKTVVLVDAEKPEIHVVDTASDEIVQIIRLQAHRKPAQIARYTPDGQYLVVTSHEQPLATILDPAFKTQRSLKLGKGPMNMAFHPDGRTLLIANHDAGTIAVVDLEKAEVLRTVEAGRGCEVLSFY
jgi:DNA-binding beta-propeller fold protein YncE